MIIATTVLEKKRRTISGIESYMGNDVTNPILRSKKA